MYNQPLGDSPDERGHGLAQLGVLARLQVNAIQVAGHDHLTSVQESAATLLSDASIVRRKPPRLGLRAPKHLGKTCQLGHRRRGQQQGLRWAAAPPGLALLHDLDQRTRPVGDVIGRDGKAHLQVIGAQHYDY